MKIVFHPEAYEEMVESARFYEERDEGLGTRFLDAVEDTIKRIRSFPHAGPVERADIRKASRLRLSIHCLVPASQGSDIHRSSDASAQATGLLEKAVRGCLRPVPAR